MGMPKLTSDSEQLILTFVLNCLESSGFISHKTVVQEIGAQKRETANFGLQLKNIIGKACHFVRR
jgi:hypothetical protein